MSFFNGSKESVHLGRTFVLYISSPTLSVSTKNVHQTYTYKQYDLFIFVYFGPVVKCERVKQREICSSVW